MAEVEMSPLQPSGPPSTPAGPELRSRRETWGSSTERIVTLLGLSIGNVVVSVYPYLHFRKGGVYFIVHLLLMILVGVPLLLMEYFVGQFTSSDCIGVFAHFPAFKGIGIVSCLVTLVVLPYLTVVDSYSLSYLGYSFTNIHQWASCSNLWNSAGCFPLVKTSGEGSKRSNNGISSPTEEFFRNKVLQTSSGIFDTDGLLLPQVVASLMICLLIFVCLIFGVRGLGKVCCFTQGISLVLSFALFIRAVTLPGAKEGLYYFFAVDVYDLNLSTFTLAVSHVVFSFGLGHGLYSTLGSYNSFRNNFLIDISIVSIGSAVFSFFMGMTVFSLEGFIAKVTASEFSVKGGIEMPYATLTAAFSLMPQSQLWAIVFFSFLFFVSVDTLMVMVQVVVQCIQNHISMLRNKPIPVSLVVCALTFINSLLYCSRSGLYWIAFIDTFVNPVSFLLVFLETIVFAYVYGAGRLARDLEMLSNTIVSYYCFATWLVITPALLLVMLIYHHLEAPYLYRRGAPLGFLTAFCLMMVIPVYSIYYVLRGNCCRKYKGEKSAPWAPTSEVDVAAWKDFCSRRRVLYPLCHRTFE